MWTYERLFAEASTILSSKDGFSLDSLSNQSKHVPKRAKRAKRIQKQKTQAKMRRRAKRTLRKHQSSPLFQRYQLSLLR